MAGGAYATPRGHGRFFVPCSEVMVIEMASFSDSIILVPCEMAGGAYATPRGHGRFFALCEMGSWTSVINAASP